MAEEIKVVRQDSSYKWVVCTLCVLMMFMCFSMPASSFSTYMPFLRDLTGLSNTQTSLMTTIRNFAALITLAGVTKYYEVLNIRIGMTGAFIASAGSFFLVAAANGNFTICCIAAVLQGFSYSYGGPVPIATAVNRWFRVSNKKLALGICSAGSGIAQFVVPQYATRVTCMVDQTTGTVEYLRIALIGQGCFILVGGALMFLLMRNQPKLSAEEIAEDKRLAEAAEAQKKLADAAKADAPAAGGKYLDRSGYILVIIAFVTMGMWAGNGWTQVSLLYRTAGYDPILVANAISLSVVLIPSKIIYGWLNERLPLFVTNCICFTLEIIGAIGMILADVGFANGWMWIPAMGVLGHMIGAPIHTIGASVWSLDFVPEKDYSKWVKNFTMAYTIGSLGISWAPGMIADATGSYVPAFWIYGSAIAITGIIIQIMYIRLGKTKVIAGNKN